MMRGPWVRRANSVWINTHTGERWRLNRIKPPCYDPDVTKLHRRMFEDAYTRYVLWSTRSKVPESVKCSSATG